MAARLVVATRNTDKFREIQEKLKTLPLAILSLADFPFVGEVVEDQPDLYGNAIKKAVEVAAQTGLWALGRRYRPRGGGLGRCAGSLRRALFRTGRHLRFQLPEASDGNAGCSGRQAGGAAFRTVACLRTDTGLYCVEGWLDGEIGREKRGAQRLRIRSGLRFAVGTNPGGDRSCRKKPALAPRTWPWTA